MSTKISEYSIYVFLRLVSAVYGIAEYFGDMGWAAYSTLFAMITGAENAWIFYEDTTIPVQMRYTDSERFVNNKVEWIYYARSNLWVNGAAAMGSKTKYLPWCMCTITKGGDTDDISEFIGKQRFTMPEGRVVWPSAGQLVSAWSIHSHKWFVGRQAESVTLSVLSLDCVDTTFNMQPVNLEDLMAYWSTFGDNYTPAPTVDVSSEEASDTEEEEVEAAEEGGVGVSGECNGVAAVSERSESPHEETAEETAEIVEDGGVGVAAVSERSMSPRDTTPTPTPTPAHQDEIISEYLFTKETSTISTEYPTPDLLARIHEFHSVINNTADITDDAIHTYVVTATTAETDMTAVD